MSLQQMVAVNDKYADYFIIADEIKEDSKQAIAELHKLNIETVVFSGDKQAVVDKLQKAPV